MYYRMSKRHSSLYLYLLVPILSFSTCALIDERRDPNLMKGFVDVDITVVVDILFKQDTEEKNLIYSGNMYPEIFAAGIVLGLSLGETVSKKRY